MKKSSESTEIWKTVFDGYYAVSDLGRVKRLVKSSGGERGRLLTPYLNKKRHYCYTSLQHPGRRKNYSNHSLVAETFLGPRPNGKCVNHINGIKTDNRLVNLEYVTPKENVHHAIKMGLLKTSGEDCHWSKLKNEQVLMVRKLHADGMVQRHISKKLGINTAQISRIVNRKIWKHLPAQTPLLTNL